MNLAFYTGAAGLGAFQESINLVGNNLSNANTNGYKPVQADFENLLYTRMYVNSDQRPMEGTGVRVRGANQIMEQGTLLNTERQLDFAIVGEEIGFFGIERDGLVSYTRDGAFTMANVDDEYYLATVDGAFVLDPEGEHIPIEVDEETERPVVDDSIREQIGVFYFNNPEALQPISSNRYVPTDRSGEPQTIEDQEVIPIRQRMLELSKTSVADEMVSMIVAQRGFQFSARVVQVGDEVEDIISNLRK